MRQFVNVRIVQMKDVNLAQFQFDYDLTWAGFFMNADGAIYGRYGTRSVAGPMAHNSMASLKNAMKGALELHRNYPANKASLEGKRGTEPRWKTALEIPAIRKRFRGRLTEPTGPKNCIHCHNIYDGWHETAYGQGTFDRDSLWVYPLPDNVGMQINVDAGVLVEKVIEGSFAEKAGVKAGDVVRTMNGQQMLSQADMQWVLHNLPKAGRLRIEVERQEGTKLASPVLLSKTLSLSGDWKKSDISWRGSMWSLRPKLAVWAPQLSAEEKEQLGLGPNTLALKVKWIPNEGARRAGLKNGDIIVEADGKTSAMTHARLNLWIKLNYHPGDKLPIKVLRGDRKISLMIPLD